MVDGRLKFFGVALVIAAVAGVAGITPINGSRNSCPTRARCRHAADAIIPVIAGEAARRDVPIF